MTKSAASTKKTHWLHWPWLVTAGLVLGGLTIVGIGFAAAAYGLQSRTIVKSVSVAGQSLSGQTTLQAMQLLDQRWANFSSKSFSFTANGRPLTISVSGGTGREEEEVVLPYATFDPQAAANAAFAYGHTGPFIQQVFERVSGFLGIAHRVATPVVATDALATELQSVLASQEVMPKDAGLRITSGDISVTDSVDGKSFDYHAAVQQAKAQAATLNTATIPIATKVVSPAVVKTSALTTIAETQLADMTAAAPLTVTAEGKTWKLETADIEKMAGFVLENGQPRLGVSATSVDAWITTIAKDVEVTPRDAKFSVVDGRVQEFQTSEVGKTIDRPATAHAIDQAIQKGKNQTVALVVTEQAPLTDTITPNNLGITELVAEARTNFRGSPNNRVHNLSLGAQKINGLLIKPGETFSLVTALGSIDGKNGWKPELVIKGGGRITPEYGGGLCQVATTLFRTALNAGLPIVERRNHSLRISYYEPPIGLDATIYEPKPDLRFTNDYEKYLLIQTRIEGTELIFSFYGTKDMRTVDLPEPKVYDRVGIPATKTIEVTDLPPGKKECQTPGHPGAKATATYTVTKADGTSVTQVFQSTYKAVGVICRVGKAKS